ncbi:ComEA family DNA-binding protein [Flavobacterium foetidum]|uniref:ComEA family DNA-binding protein n=1 Tax=Flavobacterium foetidum TaxID=2026681 RepID=UPI0010753EC0|nr:helix-hairpin-helix domain-containing protein [Flavobacterium foetidum]KAF2515163.1 helix-hairpin-helix domain-containing protein [Flavobacterium foetidum]
MSLRFLKPYFQYTNQQKKGLLFLFLVICILQLAYFYLDFDDPEEKFPEQEKWLGLQSQVDSLKSEKYKTETKVYLFNPNFISDYKAYKLGMSVAEIDRLLAFRKQNKFVNSAQEFQQVTKISDSLLRVISPLFKFPEWTQHKTSEKNKEIYTYNNSVKKEKIAIMNLNDASQDDLMKIYGIGEALSKRILKQKESLGCFVSMEQLNDVWGLSPEVITELNAHFKITVSDNIKKIDLNEASLKEISQFPYFNYGLAKQIVTYRSMNGNFNNIEDLAKIKGFPVEKAKIISLYLKF